jgi:hypothetical protein
VSQGWKSPGKASCGGLQAGPGAPCLDSAQACEVCRCTVTSFCGREQDAQGEKVTHPVTHLGLSVVRTPTQVWPVLLAFIAPISRLSCLPALGPSPPDGLPPLPSAEALLGDVQQPTGKAEPTAGTQPSRSAHSRRTHHCSVFSPPMAGTTPFPTLHAPPPPRTPSLDLHSATQQQTQLPSGLLTKSPRPPPSPKNFFASLWGFPHRRSCVTVMHATDRVPLACP